MYIQTPRQCVLIVKRSSKFWAPIECHGITVFLKLHSTKGKNPKVDVIRGDLSPLTNALIFGETIARLKYLVTHIGNEKIECFSELPARINGTDYMPEERKTAMRIVSKLRGL